MDSSFLGLLVAGTILRLYLAFYTQLPITLGGRVEVSTPVTSFKRLQEGLFLFQNGIAPFEGGVYHQAPLLLVLFNFISANLAPVLFVVVDVLIAVLLYKITGFKAALLKNEKWIESNISTVDACVSADDEKQEAIKANLRKVLESQTRMPKGTDLTIPAIVLPSPLSVGASFFLSPYSILSCVAMSTASFSSLSTVFCVYCASSGSKALALFSLALASYLSLYPAMLLPAIILILSQHPKPSDLISVTLSSVILFSTFLAGFLWLSFTLSGSWDFLNATYGVILFVPDLTPNIGIYWYFFIEMFDQFRVFFLIVFQILAFIFTIPLAIRFSEKPLFLVMVTTIIIATFKSYPSVADTALYIPFLLMHTELLKYMKNFYFVANCLAFATFLAPLFFNLWIYAGSGNSNFFYAITLVLALSQVILLVDIVFAMVRREWERLYPEIRRARLEVFHK
ncbi:hypothetical protein HDU97_003313 [Phlyctochytrium planicorne]|nr:hypothetical protein HDU97_003313 [Phlyctochytrium planicorne]